MIRRIYVLLAVTALLCSFPVMAGDWSGEGEVVEMGCYTKDNSDVGADHAACAKVCLNKSDGKMGLLTSDGEVIKLVAGDDKAPYKALIELAGQQVMVSGAEADGVVTVVTAKAAG